MSLHFLTMGKDSTGEEDLCVNLTLNLTCVRCKYVTCFKWICLVCACMYVCTLHPYFTLHYQKCWILSWMPFYTHTWIQCNIKMQNLTRSFLILYLCMMWWGSNVGDAAQHLNDCILCSIPSIALACYVQESMHSS